MKIIFPHHPLFSLLAAAALMLTGCSVATGVSHTRFKDAAPLPLRFSSSKAATIFYGTFFDHSKANRSETSVFLKINLGSDLKQTDRYRLNEAFRKADKNGDGIVTEHEATCYALSLGK